MRFDTLSDDAGVACLFLCKHRQPLYYRSGVHGQLSQTGAVHMSECSRIGLINMLSWWRWCAIPSSITVVAVSWRHRLAVTVMMLLGRWLIINRHYDGAKNWALKESTSLVKGLEWGRRRLVLCLSKHKSSKCLSPKENTRLGWMVVVRSEEGRLIVHEGNGLGGPSPRECQVFLLSRLGQCTIIAFKRCLFES